MILLLNINQVDIQKHNADFSDSSYLYDLVSRERNILQQMCVTNDDFLSEKDLDCILVILTTSFTRIEV
jgi:hypothetical protein